MANSRSARKRIRSSERKHARNRAVRASVRTVVGKARRTLLGAGAEGADSEEQVRLALRALDRAAEKGVLHANNARRRKSRLARIASRLARASEAEAGEQAAARSAASGGAKGRSTRGGTRKPATRAQTGKAAAKPAGRSTVASASKATRSARSARPPRESSS